MRSFLVTGLESSCTRHVSILIASNLGLVSGDWDGHTEARNEDYHVVHRSLPHGSDRHFVERDYWMPFDTLVVCSRDFNCSLETKIKWHQKDRSEAIREQERGMMVMSEMAGSRKIHIYSYETTFLLGRVYNEMFFSGIGVPYTVHVETNQINSKYIINS
jgi:hypothetical protein